MAGTDDYTFDDFGSRAPSRRAAWWRRFVARQLRRMARWLERRQERRAQRRA